MKTLSILNKSNLKIFIFLNIIFLVQNKIHAQNCSTGGSSTILASWSFDLGEPAVCDSSGGRVANGKAPLKQDLYQYCPTTSAGCGIALLGSKGHYNTNFFANSLCVSDFYLDYSKLGNLPTWDYKHPKNIRITYKIPADKAACLNSLSLSIMGNEGLSGFGVSVLRNGVLIDNQTFPAPLLGDHTINWTGNTFCSDGITETTYTIYFGFYGALDKNKKIGLDNIELKGTCGGPPKPVITVIPTTCVSGGTQSNGKIWVSNYATGSKYQYSEGSTFNSGLAIPAIPTLIPSNGIITNTLPNPASDKPYTIRVYDSSDTCYQDQTVILPPTFCPVPCNEPSDVTLSTQQATCTGNVANNDAQLLVTGVVGGDKVGISEGLIYVGPVYNSASLLTGGAYTFTGLTNPTCAKQLYTVRVYNGSNDCYIDRQIELDQASCSACQMIQAKVLDVGTGIVEFILVNDQICPVTCKDNKYIDLALTKTVSPNSGGVCGGTNSTNFVWTLTLTNEGTMDATNIQVSDLIPDGMVLVSSSPAAPTFTEQAGWLIPSLAAGANTTLTLTTKALRAGTFTNCAEVNSVYPLNDPDSSPGNHSTDEDDDACASITVTSTANPPSISKEFAPWDPKTGSGFRMMIKLINNDIIPVTLSQNLMDTLPSAPGQMVVASTPNLSTTGMIVTSVGITANAGGTSVIIPVGTILIPGLNQVFVDVSVPVDGSYCNIIESGALQLANGTSNCLKAEACIVVQGTNVLPPMISKKFETAVANINTPVNLTITVENRNSSNMTLEQDFLDILPQGLLIAGTASGTCSGVTATIGDSIIRLVSGTVIPPGICTIVVPVQSSTAGQYCNIILHNAMLVNINGQSGVGSRGLAEDCITITSTPCTVLNSLNINTSTGTTVAPGTPITLTAASSGVNNSSISQWSSNSGNLSNPGTNPTVWTAPTTPGTYDIDLTLDNKLTGYGTCLSSANAKIVVSGLACTASLTALPGTCNSSTNQYVLTGAITFSNAPTSGTMTVSVGGGGSEVFNAPFTSPQSYSIGNLTSDGASHTVTVSFSADVNCTNTTTYTAPNNCLPLPCTVSLTATPGTCNSTTNEYMLSGVITFSNAPTSGTMTVSVSGGGFQVFNAPFTSPQNYSIPALISDGLSHTVTVSFSADANCTNTTTYSAPVSCGCNTTPYALCPGESYTLTAQSGYQNYQWYTVNGTTETPIAGATSQTYVVTAVGIYKWRATDGNACPVDACCQHEFQALNCATCTASLTAVPGTCNSSTNQYTLTGAITFSNAPTSGTMTVSVSGGGNQVFTAPFTSPQNYSIGNLTSDGLSHTVTVSFSADANCMNTTTYTAPVSCGCNNTIPLCPGESYTVTAQSGYQNYQWYRVNGTTETPIAGATSQTYVVTAVGIYKWRATDGNACPVDACCQLEFQALNCASCTASITAIAGACNPSTNNYTVTGVITFSNAPTSGTMTVSVSGGGNQVFNAPFTSPQSYSIPALTSDGLSHTVTVSFSADANCTNTTTYTAPVSCGCNNTPIPLCPGESYTVTAQSGYQNYQWYRVSGTTETPIAGATSQTYVVTAVGIYKWRATDGSGCPVDACCQLEFQALNCASCTASITAIAGTCSPSTNKYTLTGVITFSNAPTSGTMTVSVSGGGNQVFNAPFTSPQSYSIGNLTSDGLSHTVTVSFSAAANCTNTTTYTAPVSCGCDNTPIPLCPGESYTVVAQTGYQNYQWYRVSGTTETPIAGATSQTYVVTAVGIYKWRATDGSGCPVDACCQLDFQALNCPNCVLTVTASPGSCVPTTNTYTLNGQVTFSAAPTTGNLIIKVGTDSVLVAVSSITSPYIYTIPNLPADGSVKTVTAYFSAEATCRHNMVYTAPLPCPRPVPPCAIVANVVVNGCNSNGTLGNAADDYFTITVTATATNPGGANRYVVAVGVINPTTGAGGNVLNPGGAPYGTAVVLGTTGQLKADGLTQYELSIRDSQKRRCFQVVTVGPVQPCSPQAPPPGCKPSLCVPIQVTKN